jgi:transposase InsO family protein
MDSEVLPIGKVTFVQNVAARDWQTISTDQFIEVVGSYIRWYNEKRIKISLGALSPIEYRESLGLTT